FPVVIQADVRQIVGGATGALADLNLYVPIPGSSRRFLLLVGPSMTWADHRYLQKQFGITRSQSLVAGRGPFGVHGGADRVGAGFSLAMPRVGQWLLNVDGAVSRLRGSAADSPVTEVRTQRTLDFSIDYCW